MKNRKDKSGRSNLLRLLIGNYLIFIFIAITLALGVYLLRMSRINSIFRGADAGRLMDSGAFRQEEYAQVSAESYLGNGGAFAVLDADGTVLYNSSESFPAELTAGELECVPEFVRENESISQDYARTDGVEYYNLADSTTKRINFLVVRTKADALTGRSVTELMVLDPSYRVIMGNSFIKGRAAFTEQEFLYLTGEWSAQYALHRVNFRTQSGARRTLLFRNEVLPESYYDKAVAAADQIWLLLIPMYIVLVSVFTFWVDRFIRRPLRRLNKSIVGMAEGKPVRASDCGGAAEMRTLGENFDSMAQKLARSEAEKLRLEQSRRKLITDISHDLKTPITVIAGYTAAIRDGKLDQETGRLYMEDINERVKALNSLINTLYEYNTATHPDFRLQRQQTDICEYFRVYFAEKFTEIELAGFTLEANIPEQPVVCMLDAFQFKRALTNLLSNTLKHNRPGTQITLTITASADEAFIRLADDGKGIPPELREHLFEPFVMGEPSRSGGGSGLGLAIAQRIVEAHQGTLLLEQTSSKRDGAVFIITLPLRHTDTRGQEE